jgi:PilZ domain-containing protein
MDERRRHPRIEINEPGLVSAGGSVMRCTVRNVSPEGAAIEVENPAFVPARFRLVLDNGAKVHECSIAWIQQNRIGVTFIAVPEAGGTKGESG